MLFPIPYKFLSTPSARRATDVLGDKEENTHISIHALREEGDCRLSFRCRIGSNFYPRPPRGGRRRSRVLLHQRRTISIHALREEGDAFPAIFEHRVVTISIHALREEGDVSPPSVMLMVGEFLSTPSARRATPDD